MTRLLAAVFLSTVFAPVPAPPELFHRDVYLMGTRARLAVYAASEDEGFTLLERALKVLERTERELTTWRDDSEISRLNRTRVGEPWRANPELCRTFAALYEWTARTAGAFDPGIGALTDAWQLHGAGRVPSDAELVRALARSRLERIRFERDGCTLTRDVDVTIDVGAFGKGEALDRVVRELPAAPWMIDLGGQVSVGGPNPREGAWTIDIAHPSDRDRRLMRVRIAGGSLSTSGNSERALEVDGARIGHMLDPRTGKPAPFDGSVVVWHEQGLAADILSTALYVMGPEAGLPWAKARGLAVCYLVHESGAVRRLMTDAFAKVTHI